MIASIQELLQKEAQAVLNIPVTDAYEKAVELIVEQVHRKKGKLVTSGMGKAGQIAMNIATTFFTVYLFYDKFCIPAKHSMETWVSCRRMTCCCSSPIRAKHGKSSN